MKKHSFIAKDNKEYIIELNEHNITVYLDAQNVGHIKFEIVDNKPLANMVWISELSLGKCKRLGIGRKCLELYNTFFTIPNAPVNNHIGQNIPLGDDANFFIVAMQQEGLIYHPDQELDIEESIDFYTK